MSVEEYVCTLDEKSLEKAKKELNEDPKNRLGAVEAFRQWDSPATSHQMSNRWCNVM